MAFLTKTVAPDFDGTVNRYAHANVIEYLRVLANDLEASGPDGPLQLESLTVAVTGPGFEVAITTIMRGGF